MELDPAKRNFIAPVTKRIADCFVLRISLADLFLNRHFSISRVLIHLPFLPKSQKTEDLLKPHIDGPIPLLHGARGIVQTEKRSSSISGHEFCCSLTRKPSPSLMAVGTRSISKEFYNKPGGSHIMPHSDQRESRRPRCFSGLFSSLLFPKSRTLAI